MKNKRTIIKELKSALVADFGEDIMRGFTHDALKV